MSYQIVFSLFFLSFVGDIRRTDLCCCCELLSLQMIKVITNFELGNMLDSLVWHGVLVLSDCLLALLPRVSLLNCYPCYPVSQVHVYSHSFSQFGGGIFALAAEPAPSSG
jgi:hypothetical protein